MFVIYHKETTRILRPKWYHKGYETEAAAKAALTRYAKKQPAIPRFIREDYAIADSYTFYKDIEKKVTKKNLISGNEFETGINTPACTDPSTETYWSM